ncbi:hypothetical protein [Roseomonas indoligenes]|uniref:Cysteine dioxygenase n=1 Tax=Roseomonas indoligenes TaxID=2820811 RepID=A0A940S6L8_9PROT|nr:hypothetical protein [Pararoseomonas indoligenes]MBP0492118.1 hypothetical protein [Pararoseomonas indoligenes]
MSRILSALRRRVADRRPPDFVIGGEEQPYLRRWWVIPRNRFFNVYLHHFLRSDDDRALHDHPWWNVSLLLEGSYLEHTPDGVFLRKPWALYSRRPEALHRVQLLGTAQSERPVWTLFITGPRVRDWGFACPKGWVPWQVFTAARDGRKGELGQGCGE